jgi:hypothetical protein
MAIETPQANRLAAGAPGRITLGNKDYIVPQAGDRDMAAFGEESLKIHSRLRSQRLLYLFKELGSYDVAKQFLADEEANERAQFDALLGRVGANGEPVQMDDRSYLFHKIAMTADGAAFMLWSLVRKDSPGVEYAEIRAGVTPETASAIGMQLLMECGLGKADPNSRGANGTPSS